MDHHRSAEQANSGQCPVDHVLGIVAGRWATLVVRDLLTGPKRFGQLRDSLRGISPKTLTERLRYLEARGMLTRQAFAEVPPRVEYRLTDRGRSLEPILRAMYEWGELDLDRASALVIPDS